MVHTFPELIAQLSEGLSLHDTKENAVLKVSDTFGLQRRIAESRRQFGAAAN